MTATLNGVRAVSVRLVSQWRGAWLADVDLDFDSNPTTPTGAASLQIGDQTLIGTIDPLLSGRIASIIRVRVVAGGGGWDQSVTRQDYHNDAGVLSTQVYQAAATAVGEVVNDATPHPLGIDFVQTTGPASRVFGDRDWFVDLSGVTQVVSRPAASLDSAAVIRTHNPARQTLLVSSSTIVLPGTTFTDSRFDGTLVARDVEQVFDDNGAEALVWCSPNAAPRAMSALTNLVRELSGREYLRTYSYRVVTQGSDGRVQLQAVDPNVGAPDLLPISIWPGMQGDSATVQLGSEVVVAFTAADPTKPHVQSFSPLGTPTKRTVDATLELDIGPSAAAVNIAGGVSAVGRVGDEVTVTLTTLEVAQILAPTGSSGGPCSAAGPITIKGTITAGSPKVKSG